MNDLKVKYILFYTKGHQYCQYLVKKTVAFWVYGTCQNQLIRLVYLLVLLNRPSIKNYDETVELVWI